MSKEISLQFSEQERRKSIKIISSLLDLDSSSKIHCMGRVAKNKMRQYEVDPGLVAWTFSHMGIGKQTARWPVS